MSNEKRQKPIIEFKDVYKNYKEVKALQGITFSIAKGEIFGYIGPNGAGKTTTMKILVGLISDYTGEVVINDELITNQTKLDDKIGYMPQNVGFQEWRTVDHALETFGLLSRMDKTYLENRISEVLEVVGLTEARKRKIKYLSGGMQQRLKLAQALLHEPEILILDEPMSGLDPTSRWQMKNIIQELAKRDITIIFSSHILKEVEDIATSIGIINKGILVKIGEPQELQDELIGGDAIEVNGNDLSFFVDEIGKLDFVERVEMKGEDMNKIIIIFKEGTNPDVGKIQLMSFFSTKNIPINNFNYLQPSLEQVYLKYVMEGNEA